MARKNPTGMGPKPIWERLNVEVLVTQFVAWLPSLLAAVIIMAFFWLLFRLTSSTLRRLLTRAGFEAAFVKMFVNVYRFTLASVGVVMAASQLGINIGAALAGLGVVGLTIGFAAKDSLSNIMAGFLIFWDKPFHVGQWVTLGEHYGKIAEITMRTTRLQTRDNRWVIIPNATVIDQILVNHSTNGETRLQIPVGIGYTDEIPRARMVILEAVQRSSYILKKPEPAVVVNNLGASTVDLIVFAWIADAEQEKPAFFALLESIKLALDKAGIELPVQQVDVTLRNIASQVWEKVEQKHSAAQANAL